MPFETSLYSLMLRVMGNHMGCGFTFISISTKCKVIRDYKQDSKRWLSFLMSFAFYSAWLPLIGNILSIYLYVCWFVAGKLGCMANKRIPVETCRLLRYHFQTFILKITFIFLKKMTTCANPQLYMGI